MSLIRPEDWADEALIPELADLYYAGVPATTPTAPVSSGTISTTNSTTNLPVTCARLNPAGAITGMVLQAGTVDGQAVELINISAFSITFDVSGTSHVADGSADFIPPAFSRIYRWDATAALWFPRAGVPASVSTLTVTNLTATQYHNGAPAAETYAATVSIDTTKGAHRIAGVNGTSAASTFNASTTGANGDELWIEVTADASGTCTITFGTNFKPSATLVVTASHFASVAFVSDGTNWKETGRSAIIAS